jgi:hypothetical protein
MGSRKAFTVEEANGLIPRMERTLERLSDCAQSLEATHEKLQLLDVLWGDAVQGRGNPDHGEYGEHTEALRAATRELEEIVRMEILDRGIRIPSGGLEHGLLDFPTTWQARWVYLCWRRGEHRIEAWHEVDGGFAGRRPLTADQANRMGREDDPAHVDDSMLDF